MRNSNKLAIAIGLSTALLACNSPKQVFTSDRDVWVRGEDASGNQYNAVVKLTFSGKSRAFGVFDRWIDDASKQNTFGPGYVSILTKRALALDGTVENSEDGKAVLLADVQSGMAQFEGANFGLSVSNIEVTKYLPVYQTCLANAQTWLESQPEGLFSDKVTCSATDSAPYDGKVTASVVDLKATEKRGITTMKFLQVPITAIGGAKVDNKKTMAQFGANEFFGAGAAQSGQQPTAPVPVAPVPVR